MKYSGCPLPSNWFCKMNQPLQCYTQFTWKIPEENSRKTDVDKWALSSCLMCHFGGFGDSNSPLPTSEGS